MTAEDEDRPGGDPGEDGDADADADRDAPGDYDALLDALDDGIAEAHRKVTSGRVRSAENERARQGWVRALAYAVNVRRQTTVDRDLEALAERVEAREAAREDEPAGIRLGGNGR